MEFQRFSFVFARRSRIRATCGRVIVIDDVALMAAGKKAKKKGLVEEEAEVKGVVARWGEGWELE